MSAYPEEVAALLERIRSKKDRAVVESLFGEVAEGRRERFVKSAFTTSAKPQIILLDVEGGGFFTIRSAAFDAHKDVVEWIGNRLLDNGGWLGQRLRLERVVALSQDDFVELKMRFEGRDITIAKLRNQMPLGVGPRSGTAVGFSLLAVARLRH